MSVCVCVCARVRVGFSPRLVCFPLTGANVSHAARTRALMRAFKYTTLVDGDGDEWVEPAEFPALLRNVVYFNKLYDVFDQMDTDNDHRLDLDEFMRSLDLVGT